MSVIRWGQDAAARHELRLQDEEQQKLLGLSDFLVSMAARDSAEFQLWLDRKPYEVPTTPEWIQQLVAELALLFPPESADRAELARFQRALRKLRYRVQRRIIWRHLARRSSHEETVTALSTLADSLVEISLLWCEAVTVTLEGEALDDSGTAQHLVVFALGKLGGRELNLSSDIDLICAYPNPGKTTKSGKTNQQFFVQVTQLLVKTLGETTGDGFGFRVDLRLRPYGDSGPLVQSFGAMERYFETSGRDWERYALIKARACAGDRAAGDALLSRLRPFVYRRYLDFAAIDSMREMRALIRRDHSEHRSNVKLCAGGIRDVEFLAQMLQLIWGGRVENLRTNSLSSALDGLVAENLISSHDRSVLWNSYELSRDVEHVLQAFRDEQTHRLPEDKQDQGRLAAALEYSDYAELLRALRQSQSQVLECLARWLDDTEESVADSETEISQIFSEPVREAIVGRSRQIVDDLRAAAARAPEAMVVERLDRLIPLLLEDIRANTENSSDPEFDVVLLRLEPLLRNVLRRSAYIVLLSENAHVRRELAVIACGGDYFTSLLAKFPALLEELFMRINLAAVPQLDDLLRELLVLLPRAIRSDLQQQHFDRLAQYKSQHQFRCLLALSRGDLSVMQMADYLTRLAQSVIQTLLEWAWYGVTDGEEPAVVPENYLVVGYGKLGGLELGAGSDLDLVFIHQGELAEQSLWYQLTRRMLSYLSMQTYFGQLYEVDIRLRPAGRDGTLVSTLSGFERYQKQTAWLWEHQALVRARPVAGGLQLAAEFDRIRRQTISASRDRVETRKQIILMRERMREQISTHSFASRLKQSEGGIVDIEFMVQYLALGWSAQFPALLDFTDNGQILQQASREGLLSELVSNGLIADYALLRHVGQMLIVSEELGMEQTQSDAMQELEATRKRVARLWRKLMVEEIDPANL